MSEDNLNSFLVVPFYLYFPVTIVLGFNAYIAGNSFIGQFLIVLGTIGTAVAIYYMSPNIEERRGNLGIMLALLTVITMFVWFGAVPMSYGNYSWLFLSIGLGYLFIMLGAFISYRHREKQSKVPDAW